MYSDDLAAKYLKEFFPSLVTRMRDLERRISALEGSTHIKDDEGFSDGPLYLDFRSLRGFWNGEDLGLTLTELKIVSHLAKTKGRCWSRGELMNQIGAPDVYEERTLDSHVKRIRKKFRMLDPTFSRIRTYYRVGYYWED